MSATELLTLPNLISSMSVADLVSAFYNFFRRQFFYLNVQYIEQLVKERREIKPLCVSYFLTFPKNIPRI